jgi:extracellular solute-binding protein
VGRHSIPDPEESSGRVPEGASDETEAIPQQPQQPPYDYGYQAGPAEPEYPDYGEQAYPRPRHDEPRYQGPDYQRPEYGEPEFEQEYEADYEDESDYDDGYESDYPGSDYDDVPEYLQRGYREPEPEDEFDGPAAESASFAGGPPPPPRVRAQHSGDWEGGEWTGSHRAIQTGRRGVSVGVIGALVAVVVVVAAFILWRFFGDALSSRSTLASARCVDGQKAVPVVVDPSIADPIATIGKKFNETANPVGDSCVAIDVKPAESDQVVNGFISDWPKELGDRPALWIPGSSVSQARLEAVAGEQTVSDSRSLVSSPVVIAIRPQLKGALGQQNWGTLPGLQSNPNALNGLNLPGWGSLRLALPLSGDSDASYLAAEAVAAASAPAGAAPSAGSGAVNTLVAGQPKLADNKSATAMDALLNANDPAAAPVHAVVTTEQQLYQRGTSLSDAKNVVASWLPPGPTAMADYPTVLLSGTWLSQEQVTAASEFARFLRKPEQLAELAKLGFRTDGGQPPKSDVTNFAPVSAPLSVGDTSTRATLANSLTAPVGNPAVTIMLDQSMNAQEGGKPRLANVVSALDARLQAMPPTSAVGLWTFDGVEGRSEVPIGPLSDPVDGRPRSAALSSALDEQTASGGGAVSFTTLRMAYDDALAKFRQGQTNSILLITSGPHTDQSLDGTGLQDYVRRTFDAAKPVAINVIDFGADSDRPTWEAVAQTTGGEYQNLSTSASPDLTSAITNALG